MSDLAEVLKRFRADSGLTAKDVVKRLGALGFHITINALYNWENGHRSIDADTFFALCDVYGVHSFEDFEKKEALPPPEGDEKALSVDEIGKELESILVRAGLIQPGGDITDDQLRFLDAITSAITTYFSKGPEDS